MTGISKSQVSRLCEDIDERVGAFLDRRIEGEWPYIWIDATYVKVRQNGRIVPPRASRLGDPGVSVAMIIAVGVDNDGRREVLGMTIGAIDRQQAIDPIPGRDRARRPWRGGRDLLDRFPAPARPAWPALRGLLAAPASPIG